MANNDVFEISAITLAISRITLHYYIEYHYQLAIGDTLAGSITHRVVDYERQESPAHLIEHLDALYAPAIHTIWEHTTATMQSRFYALVPRMSPEQAGLSGTWILKAQL